MSTRTNEKIDIGDIFLDTDKLTKFIIGASAIIGRIESHIGLPQMTAADYELYGSGTGLMNDTSVVGGSLNQYQGGFFGWIYDKVIKPVKNAVIDPVVDKFIKPVVNNVIKPVLGVARPILKNDAVQAAIGMMGPKGAALVQGINTGDQVLKTIGLGNNIDGGAYRIQDRFQGNAYRVQGNAYRVQGRGTMVPAQLRNTELDGDKDLVIGELYRFGNKLMIYTEQGFLPTHNKIKRAILTNPEEQTVSGGAYLEDGEVKIASNHGLLGSSANRKCNGNSPSDFLQ